MINISRIRKKIVPRILVFYLLNAILGSIVNASKNRNSFKSTFFNGQDELDNLNDQLMYNNYLNSKEDDHPEYSLDIAVRLKKQFADDLVSDLFATSYGLEKVARVIFNDLFFAFN
jgi:hypothetical protein